ncbi:MAG: molybdopterin-dependent oxidoreductase [Bradymonadia bacterium]
MSHSRREFLQKSAMWLSTSSLLGCQKPKRIDATTNTRPELAKPKLDKRPRTLRPPLLAGLDLQFFKVHRQKPISAESTRAGIGISVVTPTDRLFIRNNLPHPPQSIVSHPERWKLKVDGVSRPRHFSIEALKALGAVDVTTVLQCSGNGRGFFEHAPSGSPWLTGAAGCVTWRGVLVSRVLEACGGVSHDASYLTGTGADRPHGRPDSTEARVERSIPIAKALNDCILAWSLNGEPIPLSHGGPLRLVVPGYFGCNQIKYVERIMASQEESSAKIQRTGYRFRPIGEKGKPSQASMWRMPVKSWVTHASSDSTTKTTTFHGVAFSGERGISKVDYSFDGSAWHEAPLTGESLGPNAWRRFQIDVPADESPSVVFTRATDTSGDVQPEHRVENERGYGNTSWRDHRFKLVPPVQGNTNTVDRGDPLTDAELKRARHLFAQGATPPCGACHTLADAATAGQVGPSLDTLKIGVRGVEAALNNGVGAMPSYRDALSKQDRALLARYIAQRSKVNK